MLYLNPPYYVIDGVSLMPDHEDPLQYYFMPLAPHLSTMTDGELIIPKIQLIKFTGRPTPASEVVSGGFVDFDCNIGISAERLTAIAEQLRSEAGLTALPHLAPVPLIDGSVRMMIFGTETPADEPIGLPRRDRPDDDIGGPKLVIKITHAVKPSLYGDNQAAFSVRLDQPGVTILEQAMGGELLPIGIVYSLEYVGLRPAYKVHVEADWERVQTHIETSEKVNVPFIASSQIDSVVDELVEEQIITITSDLLVADGDDTSGAGGRYEAALTQVRELVFDNFFQPTLDPMERETGDTIDDFGRVLRTMATGGMTSLWERKEVDLTRIDRKKLNITMSERTSVIREIHPQGHLAGITRTIAAQGIDLSRFITSVSLEDPFFARRIVRVIPRADFSTDQIESINVSLRYDGVAQNVVFDASSTEQLVEWPSTVEGGRMRAPVTVSSEILFLSAAEGRPRSITTPSETIDGEVVQVSPRDDAGYEIRWISMNVVDFPWHIYHTIEIRCAYVDVDNGINIRNHYGLTSEHSDGAWPVFALDPARRTVDYRLVAHGYDGRDWDSGDLQTDDDQIRITDPFGTRRTLDIVVPGALFGTALDRVFVDVSYEDAANEIHKRESFELSAGDAATKQFSVELIDLKKRRVTFKVSMLRPDGSVIDIPESTTELDRIFVTPQMRGHRSIAISADGAGFVARGITSVRVETLYERVEAGLRFVGDVVLTPEKAESTFEYDFTTGDAAFQYKVTEQLSNGLTRDTGLRTSDEDQIIATVD